jgi:hypothetical protein
VRRPWRLRPCPRWGVTGIHRSTREWRLWSRKADVGIGRLWPRRTDVRVGRPVDRVRGIHRTAATTREGRLGHREADVRVRRLWPGPGWRVAWIDRTTRKRWLRHREANVRIRRLRSRPGWRVTRIYGSASTSTSTTWERWLGPGEADVRIGRLWSSPWRRVTRIYGSASTDTASTTAARRQARTGLPDEDRLLFPHIIETHGDHSLFRTLVKTRPLLLRQHHPDQHKAARNTAHPGNAGTPPRTQRGVASRARRWAPPRDIRRAVRRVQDSTSIARGHAGLSIPG